MWLGVRGLEGASLGNGLVCQTCQMSWMRHTGAESWPDYRSSPSTERASLFSREDESFASSDQFYHTATPPCKPYSHRWPTTGGHPPISGVLNTGNWTFVAKFLERETPKLEKRLLAPHIPQGLRCFQRSTWTANS